MDPLRILIADDERPAREFLKRLLLRFDDVELVGEAANGSEAVEMIKRELPDLALLDLQMPEMTGLEAARAIGRSVPVRIAFVTAFDDHAIQAFELNAIDYLLKPVEESRLAETIQRARSAGDPTDEADRIEGATIDYEAATNDDRLERVPVRKGDDFLLIPVSEIVSVFADGELLYIHSQDGGKYVINFRLKALERRLDPARFLRISRSALVNVGEIDRVTPLPGGTFVVTLKNGQEVATSRSRSRSLRDRLLRL